jgi:hypothetical protein
VTDIEELFRPLIDESAPYREPVDAIEARVRDLRVRRRRQRAQVRFGAAFVVVALVATAVGVVHARDNTSAPPRPGRVATTTPPPTTPSVVVPARWSTYDYGLARLSIPPGWTAGTGCPGPHELVLADPTTDSLGCGAGGTPSIEIAPLRPPTVHEPYVIDATVNGIGYESVYPKCLSRACPELIAYVPSLRIALSFVNVHPNSILKTLTYSTYARIFQQPFGAVPASWKTVAFDGFSVRVPADWATIDLAKTGGFCGPAPNTVYIGTPTSIPGCAFLPLQPPRASLQLEATDASAPPTDATGWHHNGLRFTRQAGSVSTPLSTELFLNVDGPHGRILLGLGLGPDPAVARSILGSLEPVGP